MREEISQEALSCLTDQELKSKFNNVADRLMQIQSESHQLMSVLNKIQAEIYWRRILK